jgi:hypothetical protein
MARKNSGPSKCQLDPDRGGKFHCRPSSAPAGFPADEATAEKRHGEQPVHHRRLPFDENGIVQNQRRPAQDQHQAGGDQRHLFDPALPQPDPADLGQGRDDQHAGRDVDIRQFVGDEEQYDGQEVEQQFHADNRYSE